MPLTVGTRVGPYEIVGPLGAGGMGEVYRARDLTLGREVAIKVLPQGVLDEPERRARFDREAKTLASLNHPHIAAIFGVEDHGAMRALVLELVEGPTLTECIAAGAMPSEDATAVARQIAEALNAAHQLGIVHRDLKPANVKICQRGTVKLLDFGIATQGVSADGETVTRGASLTATGKVMGTVGYMSPEQIRGDGVDARSDQFALGLILFEMLTGRHPFSRVSSAETVAAILRDVAPTGEFGPAVPAPLRWIVERCLAKEPAGRYASTEDLARDLATLRDRLAQPQPATTPRLISSLPISRTPLVGREAEREAAATLLLREDVRLVTFTGSGGAGKTRLALQVAADVQDRFGGGVVFVSLSAVTDAARVASAVAERVGLREGGSRDPVEGLKEVLGALGEPMLLVLDNFEQVRDAAPLVTELLESCAWLTVLVTSQAILHVYGEHAFEVPPLDVPSRRARPSLADLSRCSAIALFVQRATAARSDFSLTPDNASAVAEICRRLDGLPLAIELAAARIRMLTPEAMLRRLESRFELLTGGARDLPARQRTLLATVVWSCGLLTPDEQTLFRRLGVFVSGCTLEAAEAVCNAMGDLELDALDGLESLLGQSLIQQTQPASGEARFTMLQTIRDYAVQRLRASPDEAVTCRAHAAYCLVLAEEGRTQQTPEAQEAWMDRCTLEHDNFRAALDWAIQARAVEWGGRLGGALIPFWLAREHFTEGQERVEALLDLAQGDDMGRTRAALLPGAGILAFHHGDYETAGTMHQEALAAARAIGDVNGVHSSLVSLGGIKISQGDWKAARRLLEECVEFSTEVGDESMIAQSLGNLAHTLQLEGDAAEAKALCERALEIFARTEDSSGSAWMESCLGDLERELGDSAAAARWYALASATFERMGDRLGLARTSVDVAMLAVDEGEDRRARDLLHEALELFKVLKYASGVARVLDGFACLAAKRGRATPALRLAGAAEALRHEIGVPLSEPELEALAAQLETARQTLGDSALAASMEGWAMSPEAAIAYALGDA